MGQKIYSNNRELYLNATSKEKETITTRASNTCKTQATNVEIPINGLYGKKESH